MEKEENKSAGSGGVSMDLEALGALMKSFEGQESEKALMPGLPSVARLDGRSFSLFTKDLKKPFDMDFCAAMDETLADLVAEFGCAIGYTQSDEINLLWAPSDPRAGQEMMFGGRIQKMASLLASRASVKFALSLAKRNPGKIERSIPSFDCRIFQFPDKSLAADCFVWREADASKNSISMIASSKFSHKALNAKSSKERKEMLREAGSPWEELPARVKRGVWALKVKSQRVLTDQELARIPEAKRPTGPIERSRVEIMELPPMSQWLNREEALFEGAMPKTIASQTMKPGPK